MLSKEVSSTIFWVFGMTRPGIEPRSPGPLANTLTTRPMSSYECVLFLFYFGVMILCCWNEKMISFFFRVKGTWEMICHVCRCGLNCRMNMCNLHFMTGEHLDGPKNIVALSQNIDLATWTLSDCGTYHKTNEVSNNLVTHSLKIWVEFMRNGF